MIKQRVQDWFDETRFRQFVAANIMFFGTLTVMMFLTGNLRLW